jgi:Flp pilus assembly protein TadD
MTSMVLVTIVCFNPGPAAAALFGLIGNSAPAKTVVSNDNIKEIQSALDEQRYLDAGNLLDRALAISAQDPSLVLLVGELSLARSHYSDALTNFKSIEANPAVRARALEGEGIALSYLNRSNEAISALQTAVTEDPTLWRAWNTIGSEFDKRRDWVQAKGAYDHALANSDAAAIVLNNRGYSLLLQRRPDEATADFLAALKKKPDLAPARTNLRLAIAMKGDYDHAIAGGAPGAQAALLNNAGVAAMSRGDYREAENLFGRAIKAKGEYYAQAVGNLEITHTLESRGNSASGTVHDATAAN